KNLQPLIAQLLPPGIGAIVRRLFQQQIPTSEVHEDRDHAFQEGFIHGPNDLAPLPTRLPVLFPSRRRLQQCGLQRLHHTAQGRGGTPYLRLQTQMREKLVHRLHPHAALQAKGIERGDDQARQPLPVVCGFPEPGFRVVVTALHGLLEAMHATLGQASLLGNASHALGPVVTKTLENPQAFVPKSHVGLVLQRVAELSPEFSSSAYMTDTSLSRLKPLPVLPYIPEERIEDVVYVNPADTQAPIPLNPLYLDADADIDL